MVGQMLLESLKMNFNYSCFVNEKVSGTNHSVHILSKPVLFSTVHGGMHSSSVCVKYVVSWFEVNGRVLCYIALFLTNEPSALARCLE